MKTRIPKQLAVAALSALLLAPLAQAQTYYSTTLLSDAPFLYWNFDEAEGNALQLAPLNPAPPTAQNDLVSVNGANRVSHADVGGLPKLGNTANFSGANFFQATKLETSKSILSPPYAFEFWMQAQGANTENRADYLMNFGNAGGDNYPAFIWDFEPDTLEMFGGGGGRTSTSPPISDANWHHIVWVMYGDGASGVANRCDLWVDGVNFGNVRDTFARGMKLNERLLVGAATTTPDNGFEGRLDELAVYDLSTHGDEAGVSAKVTQLVGDHYLEATTETGNAYKDAVLADAPLLYWNFDEADGNALQLAPPVPPNNANNQMASQAGAIRVTHEAIGSGFQMGNALELNGANYFSAADLDAGLTSLSAPWAVEFWMQVRGANTIGSNDRQDYLMNFDHNSAAFIYDYKAEQLEMYAGTPRTDNGPIIADGNWHHVIWVYYGDGTTGVGNAVEAFLDGVNVGRNMRATFNQPLNVRDNILIGAALVDGTGGFEGRLDELAVYHLTGLADEAAVRARVTTMASNHFLAAYGPPGNASIEITQQPADASAVKGGTATFTVSATVSGAPPESLTYQWLRNGSPIAGATSSSYTTPILTLADLGTSTYSVRVSTVGGVFVISQHAVLTVPVPPYEASYYTSQVLADDPFFYWNFDENAGNALQRAPLGPPTPVATENDLVPVAGASRVESFGKLGRAASLSGNNYYQAAQLRVPKATLAAPWAFEFWFKVEGDNSGERANYLFNFGNYPGGDNAPAFIYDFKPNQLEIIGGGRTDQGPLVSDAAWHHVVWVFYGDGTAGVAKRVDAYVDGVVTPNVAGDFSRSFKLTQGMIAGAATTHPWNGFQGELDEVAIYDLSGLADESAVTAKAQSLASHYASASSGDPQPYSELMLAEAPVLYWNFDETDGNALQIAPVIFPPFNNSQNELVPILGANRVEHAYVGSGLFLGNAANLSGMNFYQALDLEAAKTVLPGPWAVEYWFQVRGENATERADYIMNFGTSPDNRPAFIYDYNPDQLEAFAGALGRSANNPVLSDGNWHHIMWVYYGDGVSGVADRLEAWIDGANVGNVRGTFSSPIHVGERLLLGAATPSSDGGFEGRIDELAVYDLSGLTTENDVATRVQDLVTRHQGAANNPHVELKMVASPGQLDLSWTRSGFILQESADLTNPNGWADISDGTTTSAVIPVGASGNKFYRLRSQ